MQRISGTRRARVQSGHACTLLLAALASSPLSAQQANQQTTPPAGGSAEEAAIERVVVTGSHIRRVEEEGALPVQVVTQEQIKDSGATNVEQLLQSISAAVQGNNNLVAASTAGALTGGVSAISLRGLGAQRTLVLINGRRLSGGGTITDSASVDVNGIPLAAIERVEVLKDGASAIYGSDAIAGVVNFILREEYQGAEVTAYGGGTNDGGAVKRFSGLAGFGDLAQDRYNVMLMASYQKEDGLLGRQRDFAKSGINVAAGNDVSTLYAFPANILAADGSFGLLNPNAPNACAPSVISPFYGPGICAYDPSPFISLLPETERASVYGALHFALTDDVQLYAEASFNRNRQRTVVQPVPIFALMQPTSPYYPTAFVQANAGGATPDIFVAYRSRITGNRDITDTSEQPRTVLGVKGTLAGWDFDANLLYTETRLTERANHGYPLTAAFQPLIDSGQVNFFGADDPAAQAQADAAQFRGEAYSTKTSLAGVAGNISRDLLQLPAGPLAIALGAEARKEKFATDPSDALRNGEVNGYPANFTPIDASRNASAVFAEFNIPLLASLDAQVAGRYDHYQVTGGKATPKVALRWKPLDELMFRASYGKGFRAPSLSELYQPQLTAPSNSLNDPARCNRTDDNGAVNVNVLDCAAQFPVLVGGNTRLKPEQSTNYTLGFVVEPVSGISLGVDAFKVKLEDTIISGIDPSIILADPAQFGFLVTRGPPDPNTPGLPGHITQIQQTTVNFGETRVEGLDVDLHFVIPTPLAGTLTAGLNGTYFSKYEVQNLDGSFRSVNGKRTLITNGSGGAIPRWHHYLWTNWNAGSWEAGVAQNFQSGYEDLPGNFEDTSAPTFKPRRVASYVTHNVHGAYSGIAHLKLELGIRNVLDRDPPYTNAGGQDFFQAGYDPGYADPLGRFFYGSVTYSIK